MGVRIGVMIKNLEELSNWELRIIQGIINDPKLKLALFIKDGRTKNKETFKEQFTKFISTKNSIGQLVLNLQLLIERKLFFKAFQTIDKSILLQHLSTIDLIKLEPEEHDGIDFFNDEDSNTIAQNNLDVILKFGFNKIEGNILNSANFGIWSLLYADKSGNKFGPIAFWKVLHKEPSIEVSLQQLFLDSVQDKCLDKAYFNCLWSVVNTTDTVLEGSVSLVLKNLRKIYNGTYTLPESIVSANDRYTRPSLYSVFKYTYGFYSSLIRKGFKALNIKYFGVRYQHWTLFLGKGNFITTDISQLRPVNQPIDEFWADPFLFQYGNKNYVFFETFCYKTKKGKLSCGIIENDQLTNIVDVLNLEYHLSYPFIFEEDGEIYLMPETLDNKRLEIYKCIHFPTKWELYTTAFEGEFVADASFYNDKEGQKWLFINKKEIPNLRLHSELFIYKVDSLKLNTLVPHTQNPVIIDTRTGRNGGAIFSYNNEIYRPSQRTVEGIYGRALNINKIKELTINSYIEENTMIFEPDFKNGLMSMHHLHQIDGLFVYDAAYKKSK